MKIIKVLIISAIFLFLLGSCNNVSGERFPLDRVIIVNMDGKVECVFPYKYNDLNCHHGVIVPMHDNHSFILYNENLFIMDSMHETVTPLLPNIIIDDENYNPGREMIGVSQDDNYIAFTSEKKLHCLNVNDNVCKRLTNDVIDRYPAFGIDDKIFFSRYNIDDDSYRLMRINIDGSELSELCSGNSDITRIFPSNVNSNIVYFVTEQKVFHKLLISESSDEILLELGTNSLLIARTNDDRYFSFSNCVYGNKIQYLVDTQTNVVQHYFDDDMINSYISRVLPNNKTAMIYYYQNLGVKLKHWDIESNTQIGNDFIIDDTENSSHQILSITPDGYKFAIIHETY